LEPLHGYLSIASQLLDSRVPSASTAWNFGPGPEGHKTVGDLVSLFHELWGDGDWEPDGVEHPHETSFLSLAIDKAVNQLGWTPTWNFRKTVSKTVEWYRSQQGNATNMQESCRADITAFISDINNSQSQPLLKQYAA
ncbi:MAG: hypothetical protein KAT44_13945, partial [Pirellulales bacterium]|nr:hypothetical protein [Pirellulales bacterium]